MNTKAILAIVGGVVVVGVGVFLTQKNIAAPSGVTCTQEAKQCSDGSYVGRTGPNCEFAACPAVGSAVLEGRVVLSPTCPVERTPPEPSCAPRPYQTTVTARGPQTVTISNNEDGSFIFRLEPGTYKVSATGGNQLPKCEGFGKTVDIKAYTTTTVEIVCDSGVR